jgi:hypothetical protein
MAALLTYKGHLIFASSRVEASTRLWTPTADISWADGSEVDSYVLTGSALVFETKEDAEQFGVQMAKMWIQENRGSVLRKPSEFN